MNKLFFSMMAGAVCLASTPAFSQIPFPAPAAGHAEPASLISLVANGAGYNRKQVLVAGYLAAVGADLLLFVSKEHAEASDLASAIRIEAGPAGRAEIEIGAGSWIWLTGNFRRQVPSDQAPWAGALENAAGANR